ncbi:Microtubule-associated protein 70-2 [Cocos nucifera]|uniref:Microtubule-associated protein 70-2 n=1 Tax=Cocos nucifera TaxID=13894 RepID=A0A8K0I350_COCNU|nr:Microtubule-associated protein 70-2 [Cocos nucifera]
MLTASASFKGEGKAGPALRRRPSIKPSLEVEEFINMLHGSDPVRVELSRLENEARDKDRELGEAQAEIKALKLSERAREKAVEEVNVPTFYWTTNVVKIAKLQDDNRALDRLTKSKEAALLEAERTVQIALAKASMVDDLQNKNQELMKQIEICQEENKILDKMHRQKVAEVEKLSQTVKELEEAVLAGGAAANAVRDYKRKVQEMNDEMKTLDRELARAKVTANRVAVVVANEWKDANDKGEMQQLRDKLAIAERTARSEAQLKEKYQLRLKVLEEGLRMSANGGNRTNVEGRSISNGPSRRQSLGGAENISKSSPNGFLSKRPSFQLRSSLSSSTSAVLKHAKGTSKSFDGGTRSLDRGKVFANGSGLSLNKSSDATRENEAHGSWKENPDEKPSELPNLDTDNCVSGLLYDMLQKEVITLRKACYEKDQSLKDKDDAIEMLAKKVDTLTKAMEVEAKKMRREVAAMEKEVAAMRTEKEQDNRAKRLGSSKGPANSSQLLPGRYVEEIDLILLCMVLPVNQPSFKEHCTIH